MNSKRILAAVLAATLSVSAVSVVAFADEPAEVTPDINPTAVSVKEVHATFEDKNGWFALNTEDGKDQTGKIDTADGQITIIPGYAAYGTPGDTNDKTDVYVKVVTNIDYTPAPEDPGQSAEVYSVAKDSEISKDDAIAEAVDGKLVLTIKTNLTDFGSSKKLLFTIGKAGDTATTYKLVVTNAGSTGSTEVGIGEEYKAEIVQGIKDTKIEIDGNTVSFTFPDGATVEDMQKTKYIIQAKTTVNGKEFWAESKEYHVLTRATEKGVEWDFGAYDDKQTDKVFNSYGVEDTILDADLLGDYFVLPYYNVKVVVKAFNYGEAKPGDDATDPSDDKPTDNKTGKKITIKGGAMEGDALNELIFNALGIKSWDEIETIKFTSDKPFSFQFATNDGGWCTMAKSAARYEDDQLSTEWTLGKDELATLDTTKNGGAYVKIDSGEKDDFDVYIEATLKKTEDTSKDNTGDNKNPSTGIALAIAPVVLAAGAVIAVSVSKKRK